MDTIRSLFDLLLHLDHHHLQFTLAHGAIAYGALLAVVFAETGLVVTPFLPGDSRLFTAGTL